MEGRVERAFFHLEDVTRSALNMKYDAVSVEFRNLGKGFEHQQVERSLQIVSGHLEYPYF
jgi:hypothetical protein